MLKLIYLASVSFIVVGCYAQNNLVGEKSTTSAQNEVSTVEETVCKAISAEDFKAGIGAGSVQILDVRTPQETALGTIDNAIEINYYDADFKARVAQLDRDIPVYVQLSFRWKISASRPSFERFRLCYNL